MIKAINKGYYFNIGGRNSKKVWCWQGMWLHLLQVATIGGTYNLTDGFHPDFYGLSKFQNRKNKKMPFNLPLIVYSIWTCWRFIG
jgi:hypothetical protein